MNKQTVLNISRARIYSLDAIHKVYCEKIGTDVDTANEDTTRWDDVVVRFRKPKEILRGTAQKSLAPALVVDQKSRSSISSFFPPPWQKPEAAHKQNILQYEIRTRFRWYVYAIMTCKTKFLTFCRCH
jgi:hypothetical protein